MTDEIFEQLKAILSRKRQGIDNDEDESCLIMRAFDASPAFDPFAQALAAWFPLEFQQWGIEVEDGQRVWTYREDHKP